MGFEVGTEVRLNGTHSVGMALIEDPTVRLEGLVGGTYRITGVQNIPPSNTNYELQDKENPDIQFWVYTPEPWELTKVTGNPQEGFEDGQPEYTGASVSYYKFPVEHPTEEGRAPYVIEVNDIIEALDLSFAEGNVIKATLRQAIARKLNLQKKGYEDGLYDSEKVVFFGERMVVKAKAEREG